MRTISRILVPTDFGDCARAALEHATTLAERLGAQVDAVHVLDLPHYLEGRLMVPTSTGASEPLEALLLRRAGREMERFLAGTSGVAGHVEMGDVVERIVDVATRGGYDLVVMGTHGKRRGILTGSVTERVVRQAPCPVLAMRAPADGGEARPS